MWVGEEVADVWCEGCGWRVDVREPDVVCWWMGGGLG